MITVVCFLWSDPIRVRAYRFTPDHVVTLQAMVRRHLLQPHEFVCITDETISGIRTLPIDWTKHVAGSCAVKLMLWRPDIAGLLGRRILALDLDCVVTGDLDPLVERDDDVVLWRNPNYPAPGRAYYQGSMQLLTAGARPELWQDFDPLRTPAWLNRRFGGMEQAWLSERLSWDEAYWTASDGVYGAGRLGDLEPGVRSGLPGDARIVFFPGNREPSMVSVQEKHPWVREHYR